MNLPSDIKSPSPVEFLTNKSVVSLEVKENFLHVRCLKKLNPFELRPCSSFHNDIQLRDILSTAVQTSEGKEQTKVDTLNPANGRSLVHSPQSKCFVLLVHIAVRGKGSLWRLQTLKFRSNDEVRCSNWSTYLNEKVKQALLQSCIKRPKSLLVFVNPYGGKHRAIDIHKQIVSPIFSKSGVKQDVVITKYQNHAKDYLQTVDLTQYDGVVAVGGDGMVHEIINGVLIQIQTKNNIPLDRKPCDLSETCPSFTKPDIRIGVIPAGSTNCLSYVSQGYDDPETAALHIAVGDEHPLDLSSIHDRNGVFQRFSFSMTSFGYYGNVLKLSERMRRLGPSRYDFAGIHHFLHQSSYNMEVQYLPSDTNIDTSTKMTRCRYPCKTCSPHKDKSAINSEPHLKLSNTTNTNAFNNFVRYEVNSNVSDGPIVTFGEQNIPKPSLDDLKGQANGIVETSRWKVANGKFLMINSALMSCACGRCPQGLSPSAHLSDGNIDLILVRNCSKADFLRYMFSHVGGANRFRFPFVEVHRVKGFRCIPTPAVVSSKTEDKNQKAVEVDKSVGCWNTDGELVADPSIHVWVHQGLIKLFARGVESK